MVVQYNSYLKNSDWPSWHIPISTTWFILPEFRTISLIILFKQKVTNNLFFQGILPLTQTLFLESEQLLKRWLLRVYISGTKVFAGLGGPLWGGGGIAERLYFVVRITWYLRALSDKLRSLWMDPYNGTIDPVSMCRCPSRWTCRTLSFERLFSILWPGRRLEMFSTV